MPVKLRETLFNKSGRSVQNLYGIYFTWCRSLRWPIYMYSTFYIVIPLHKAVTYLIYKHNVPLFCRSVLDDTDSSIKVFYFIFYR